MRFLTIFLLVCSAAGSLFAQKGDPYLITPSRNTIQAPILIDCYQYNLDAGINARDRGDCRTALRYFKEALSCEEVAGDPARKNAAENYIAECSDESRQIQAAAARRRAIAVQTQQARRYLPGKRFLEFRSDSCYDITVAEAGRAFAQKCWDDAAKLYRAAKNCADADQQDRLDMNDRIAACRAAADAELLAKEQEALNQARHATADNIAGMAQNLLAEGNRTLAFRLADFANEYIAPEDNPRCMQAMMNAWYFIPETDANGNTRQIPFGFHLAANLSGKTKIVSTGKGKNNRFYAYNQENHALYSWNSKTFEPYDPVFFTENIYNIEAVPDQQTLALFSNGEIIFWRSPRSQLRLPLHKDNAYAFGFSNRGDMFYYWQGGDTTTIYQVSLKDGFQIRKGAPKSLKGTPYITGIGSGFIDFALHNGQCWLRYMDRIEIIGKTEYGKPWQRIATMPFIEVPDFSLSGKLFPSINTVAVWSLYGDSIHCYRPGLSGAMEKFRTFPSSVEFSRDGSLYTSAEPDKRDNQMFFSIRETLSGNLRYQGTLPDLSPTVAFPLSFSDDQQWLFTQHEGGNAYAWHLTENPACELHSYETAADIYFSPNAAYILTESNGAINIYQSDAPARVFKTCQIPTNAYICQIGNSWIAYSLGKDSLVALDYLNGKRWIFPLQAVEPGAALPVAFSDDGNFMCYPLSDSMLIVYNLNNGKPVAGKILEEPVSQIAMIQKTGEILFVQAVTGRSGSRQAGIARLWRFEQDAQKTDVLRLHGYNIQMTAVHAAGELMALSDGHDIRIYKRSNLLDEWARIPAEGKNSIVSLAFNPQGTQLAAAYDDGQLIFWDVASGQKYFQLPKATPFGNPSPMELRFSPDGHTISQLNFDRNLIIRKLDPFDIREEVQGDFRKLIGFSADEIHHYGLEKAFNFPGNFGRLAGSDEWPLIRSFLSYYSRQALRSNNIARVNDYCNRAWELYKNLDEASQTTFASEMADMYRDYIWKWLLRNGVQEAESALNQLGADFAGTLQMIESKAWIALFNNDFRNAAKHLTDWTLQAYEELPDWQLRQAEYSTEFSQDLWWMMDSVAVKFKQLSEYELLTPEQERCLCAQYQSFPMFKSLCHNKSSADDGFMSAETKKEWSIVKQTFSYSFAGAHYERRYQMLKPAVETARELALKYPDTWFSKYRDLVAYQVKNLITWGDFEQNNQQAMTCYREGLALSESRLNPHPTLDTAFLGLNARLYRSIGFIQQERSELAQAEQSFRQALKSVEALMMATADSIERLNYFEMAAYDVYKRLGMCLILQGKMEEGVRLIDYAAGATAIDRNDLTPAYAALVSGNETTALIAFGSIQDESQLAEALYAINRIVQYQPALTDTLAGFTLRLKSGVMNNRKLNTDMVEYYYAQKEMFHYVITEQLDSAFRRSESALRFVEKALNAGGPWTSEWLDGLINVAFYTILARGNDPEALNTVIRYAEKAAKFLEQEQYYYGGRDFLFPNLAHAYILRNKPGDRQRAIDFYKTFLNARPLAGYDYKAVLEKDFRDLKRAGIQIPDFAELMNVLGLK